MCLCGSRQQNLSASEQVSDGSPHPNCKQSWTSILLLHIVVPLIFLWGTWLLQLSPLALFPHPKNICTDRVQKYI